LDVQMEVFSAGLSDPCTPTGCEIEHVLAALKSNWNISMKASPFSLIGKRQFVNNLAALAKAVALLPLSNLTTVLIGPFVSWVALAKPKPEGAVFDFEGTWQ
jgi:hypothetical protein